MSFDIERLQRSTRRVTKFLRKNSKRPGADAIHNLRTSARSLETTFVTLRLNSKKSIKRLLVGLKEVRKPAGKVRDMDVLIADALTLPHKKEQDCLVQLLEYLGAERNQYARKLRRVIKKTDPPLRRSLKRESERVERLLKQAANRRSGAETIPMTIAKTIQLSAALTQPPRLDRNNLHEYRLKVKELRNVLQLSDKAETLKLTVKLGEVKDAIGDWHDWEELVALAAQVLDHGKSCQLIKQLKAVSDSKYEDALSQTNDLRVNYLQRGKPMQKSGQRRHQALVSKPVLTAASAIAQD
jgi:CHAD domain-containing protein